MIQLELLWKLQSIDKEISETQKRIKDRETYDRLVEIKKRHNEAKESMDKNSSMLDANEKRTAGLNSDLKFLDQKIKANNQMIYGNGTSMKVVNSLEKENGGLKDRVDDIENELLSLIEEHERLVYAMENDKKLQVESKKEFDELRSIFKENGERFGKRLESLEADRKNILKEVDTNLYCKYNDIASKKQNPVSMVKDSVCTECGFRINTSLLDNLKKQKEVYRCEYCGRILYLEV